MQTLLSSSLTHAAGERQRVKAFLLTLCPLPSALRSLLLALCPLLFALCPSASAQTYSDTTFVGSVHTQGWSAISGISLVVTNGGYMTNLYAGTNLIARTNYYRLSATNQAGRTPTTTNVFLVFTGSTSLSNAVLLTWTRPGGIQRQVIEKSYDAGSTWTNWLTLNPSTNTVLDPGSNTWTASVFSNTVSAIPAATYPWPSSSDFSALAETAGVTRIIADAASNLAAAASAASGSNTAWLASLTPSQQVDRTWLTALTPSQAVDRVWLTALTPSQQVDRAWLAALTPSQQVDRVLIGNVSNTLDAVKINPKYVTSQAASELANEQVLSATDFRVENNRVNIHSRFDANDAMLAFKIAEMSGITALDLAGSLTWIFNNQSGVDLAQTTNHTYVSTGGGYYKNTAAGGAAAGSCLLFDGTDDAISVVNGSAVSALVTTTLTMTAWICYSNSMGYNGGCWVQNMTDAAVWNYGWGIYDYQGGSGGKGQIWVAGYQTTVYFPSGANTGTADRDRWMHVAVRWDQPAGIIDVWTNGVKSGSNVASYAACPGNALNDGVSFGAYQGGQAPMLGLMDDVCAWRQWLSDEAITNIYNGGSGLYDLTPYKTNMLYWFHMDENTGTDTENFAPIVTNRCIFVGAPTWTASDKALNSAAPIVTNMTLISTNIFGGLYTPTYARLLVEQQNIATNIVNNDDVKYWVSGNNGTNWDQILLSPLTSFAATNSKVYLDGVTNWTMTALTNQWRWKVTTPGKKETRIYKVNMGVGQ